jgi:multidrug efflux system outer membrane protein
MKVIQPMALLAASTCRITAFPVMLVMAIALSGCAVGPDYKRPEATTIPAAYTGASGKWKVAAPQAHLPKGDWWGLFGDPELSRLETEAAESNQDLKAAYARFNQARAVADVASSSFFPHLGGSFQPVDQRDSENRPVGGKPGQTYDSFTLPFDLSYEFDLWGRVRRTVESAKAQTQAVSADV